MTRHTLPVHFMPASGASRGTHGGVCIYVYYYIYLTPSMQFHFGVYRPARGPPAGGASGLQFLTCLVKKAPPLVIHW